ncbi:hypothetical protein TNCV_50201 [Trichonephila clavipes]|nr:hypothetical protein TNCV_50201 [Trichonephila clavipes]
MRDSSVKTPSFHSADHILLSSHHWWRRRLWFCVKGRPSNGRPADRPLCCKRRRMILVWASPGEPISIQHTGLNDDSCFLRAVSRTATAGSDVVQSGRPIFDDFFQHLWPYIGNNTANVVFQMVKRLWLIRIDQ